MSIVNTKNPLLKTIQEYLIITASIEIMVIGVYFFKFPNHFAFGGVTGFSTVIGQLTGLSASTFTFIVNNLLLLAGFIFLGREVGIRTVYASVLMSFSLTFLERIYPMSAPLTGEPLLELIFAILCPGIGSALLFSVNASSGGTDIIAMILKKHTTLNIGTALMLVDITSVALSFVVFGPATGLFSILGLLAKSLVIDDMITNLNLCKCFNIICDNPQPICDYIIHELGRGATVYKAEGAYSHNDKTVIVTTMKRNQAMKLRGFIHQIEPTAFMLISNSSEIVGKGFMAS